MSMILNHNVPSLMAQRIMHENDLSMKRSLEKMATGLKTKIADLDNTSGLAISEVMHSRIDGMYKAINNSQDGISLIQTATNALEQTQSILQRMRELSVQASNDSFTQQDRAYVQEEINDLREEIDRIGRITQFNRKTLLNGEHAAIWSSTNKDVKAIIKGGLLTTDQFGQKKAAEGNYKIQITATPGQADIQKTDIFKIKHADTLANKSIDYESGVNDIEISNMPEGSYNVKITGSVEASASASNEISSFGIEKSLSQSSLIGSESRASSDMNQIITENEVKAASSESNIVRITDGVNTLAEHEIKTGDTMRSIQQDLMTQLNGEKSQAIAGQSGYKLESYWNTDTSGTDTGDPEGIFRAVAYSTDGSTVKTLSVEGGSFALDKAGLSTGGELSCLETYGSITGSDGSITFSITDSANLDGNASILFEVTDVNTQAGTVTLKATADILTTDGTNKTAKSENIVLSAGNSTKISLVGFDPSAPKSDAGAISMSLNDSDLAKLYSKGDKFVYNVVADSGLDTPDQTIVIDSATSGSNPVKYAVDADKLRGQDIHFRNFYLDSQTGQAVEGDVAVTFDNAKWGATADKEQLQNPRTIASFDAAQIGQIANGDTKLRDIDKFWDSQGKLMLSDTTSVTFVQGDGKTAKVILYENDTLDEVAKKFNDAIANDLGQALYVDDASHFADFIGTSSDTNLAAGSSESVSGTFVFHSAVPGAAGKISISSSNEELLKAFSLNTIQEASETTYNVSVFDAHTGESIALNYQTTGNRVSGVIDPNVDIAFNAMSGISSHWDNAQKTYIYNDVAPTESILHLSDNTTVLQIGADEGEDMAIHIGDMRSEALGVDKVNVMNRDTASMSISIIDRAIDQVSLQMAKLGSAQNRLEHHLLNLTAETEALTGADSRIRDTDMAKEIMEFTKMQILSQTNASMMAQANQVQNQILYLFR